MKQAPICILLWLVGGQAAFGQDATARDCTVGEVREGLSLESSLLGRPVPYSVYLPPDYECSTRRYPVVYLLHGFTDDESAWIQFGEVHVTADAAILSGEIPAMILLMPDAGVTWYVNDVSGDVPYERMFVEELLPHVDSTYRTRAKREFRGLSGLSMGGYGSLMLAMRHLDLFAAVAALSSGVLTDDEVKSMDADRWTRTFSTPFGRHGSGDERLSEHWRAYNPLDLAQTLPVEELEKVRWYLDCGDDDFLYKGNAMLHVTLRNREIPHEFRVRDGGHSWIYWRTGIGPALRFIGESFHR